MSSISLKNCELAQINLLCTFICFHICSCCSIFNDRLACPRSRGQLIYYTTFFLVCQGVFRKFFKFFESFFRKLSSSKHFYAVFCAFLKAPVYYTTNLPFCQGVFRKFFEIFQSFFRDASSRPPELTSQISQKFQRISLKLRCFILPRYICHDILKYNYHLLALITFTVSFSSTAYILYHILPFLSRGFSTFFSIRDK